MGMFFAEYVPKKKSLTVTTYLPKEYGDSSLSVKQKCFDIKTPLGTFLIELPNISVSCITCRNLENHSGDYFSCNFVASEEKSSKTVPTSLETLKSLLVNGEALLCKFCSNKLVGIGEVTSFKLAPTTFAQEENLLGLETSYFCHSKCSTNKYCNPSVQLNKREMEIGKLPMFSGLYTGTEVVLNSSLLESESYSVKSQKILHCSRCRLCVGRKVSVGSDDLCALWTNCLNVLIEERDIDGDFLRCIDKPLIDESDFYGLFITSLIENECYRVIVAAHTADGLLDFMLLWLIEQEVDLYAIALPKLNGSPGPVDQTATAEPPILSDNATPTKLPTMHLKGEAVACRRVFYQLILPNKTANRQTETQELLKAWHDDFGVSLLTLPWETCIGLSTCLQQFTMRMAPQFRKAGQHMNGFSCGAVPLLQLSKEPT